VKEAGQRNLKLLIAGGGTGGHVFPALAVAREWMTRGAEREVVFVGTQRGIEARLVPEAGYVLETIRSAGLKGIGGMKFVRNVAKLAPAMWDSFAILRRHKFAVALGVGGYAAGPVMLAAVLRGLRTVVFEPNAEPGFTNRVLAGMVTRVATAYEAPTKLWGRKATLTGIPVRPEFFAVPQRTPAEPFHILITGGSQGALVINRTFVDAGDVLATNKNRISIVHQTGERDYNAVRVAYSRREINAEVVPFIGNMAERFAQADLIVCRAGAITAAEVAAAGRAAIFIPFGASTDSHQLRNAQEMERAGAARLIPEPQLTAERLTREIFSLLDQPIELQAMSANARRLAKPRAVQDIVDLIEGVAALGSAGSTRSP
jgi:UDP-N-acetylglucosamine--N-acetylmuramyl-(pentapeptide) pyrophosphoryl-undecaprenol N-acetylglucosamine transferase